MRVRLSAQLRLAATLVALSGASATFAAPCASETAPECALVNAYWRAGTGAGHTNDWYRNADGDHAAITRAHYPQLGDYGTAAYGFQSAAVDKPRLILGNASLGVGGLWGMTRYYGMTGDTAAGNLYQQYRANQHYWYPAVRDVDDADPASRDLSVAMFAYCSQSVGKSGSELDEVRKFVHTFAAFRPEVKYRLASQGLLAPTVQMIFRRTRVDSDAAYLTGLAHPSAFDNSTNDVAMVQMAQAMTAAALPPLVQLAVVSETFGGTHATRYNDASKTERLFTTPGAVARVFRGTEASKTITVDASGSFDANGRPLTWRFVLLRGDPARVHIQPLNATGSVARIDFDFHPTEIVAGTLRPSSLAVVGVFVHNGQHYSAPAFVTSLTLWNELRTYGGDGLLREIAYQSAGKIDPSLSKNRTWTRDVYRHDFNRRLAGWTRFTGGAGVLYTPEGYLQRAMDPDGRTALASEGTYATINAGTASEAVEARQLYADTDWRSQVAVVHTSLFAAVDSAVSCTFPSPNSPTLSTVIAPTHGLVTSELVGGRRRMSYVPETGFTGVDVLSLLERDVTALTSRLWRVRCVIAAPDTAAPEAPISIGTASDASSRVRVVWSHTRDNVEVAGYRVYRDGGEIGRTCDATAFVDATAVPGATYAYAVRAFDDAGNTSALSAAASGSGTPLWGQDNFEDNNWNVADAGLPGGLAWSLVAGGATVLSHTDLLPALNGRWLAVGRAVAGRSWLVTPESLPLPVAVEFDHNQRYVTGDQGLLLLYQDTNNVYRLVINRDTLALYRCMDGVETLVGQDANMRMQHQLSSAHFEVGVTRAGDALAFECFKRDWTRYDVTPPLVSKAEQRAFWVDTNATAVARFTGGRVGFHQYLISSFNVGRYDNVIITAPTGIWPDRDVDGMGDPWETRFFGAADTGVGDPASDADGDGAMNMDEHEAGTDPTWASSILEVAALSASAGAFEMAWPSVAGRRYDVMATSDLPSAQWDELPGFADLPATPPTNRVTIGHAVLGDSGFLRVRVRLPATP